MRHFLMELLKRVLGEAAYKGVQDGWKEFCKLIAPLLTWQVVHQWVTTHTEPLAWSLALVVALIFAWRSATRREPPPPQEQNSPVVDQPELAIKLAAWGTNTTPAIYKDFTDVVRRWVKGDRIDGVVIAPGPNLADWCPGTPKHLKVRYSVGDIDDLVIRRESEELTLPYYRSMQKARRFFAKTLDRMEYNIKTLLESGRELPFAESLDHVQVASRRCRYEFDFLKDLGAATDINIDHWELRGFGKENLGELLHEIQELKTDLSPFARGER